MGRDLVEERERRDPRHLADKPRMGERQPDDQRLLPPVEEAAAGACLRPVPDQRSEDGADERAASSGVAAAIVAQLARSGLPPPAPGRCRLAGSISP